MHRFMACGGLAGWVLLVACAAQATPITYIAYLSGPAESPPNASPATGTANVTLDTAAHALAVDIAFSGLLGTTMASHIHCCTAVPGGGTAMVATQTPSFGGFPLGVTSGTYSNVFDTSLSSTWNPAFISAHGGTVAGAEAELATALAADEAYLNVHSTFAPGGEIRGFLIPAPEPATLAVLVSGLLTLVILRPTRSSSA